MRQRVAGGRFHVWLLRRVRVGARSRNWTASRRSTPGRRLLAGVVAGTVLVSLCGVAYAAATASGNAKAIAFYSASQAAMAQYSGISFVGSGVSYKVTPEQGYDNFRFDFGTTPAGYKAAVDHVQVVQAGGRVTEELDTLTAPGLPPLRLWQHGSTGEVGEVMTASPCAEFIPANSASYVTVGDPFVVDSGFTFDALGHGKHGRILVRSTWNLSGSIVHETDTINGKTHLWVRSHVALEGGANNGDTLTEKDFSYSTSGTFEQVPEVGRC